MSLADKLGRALKKEIRAEEVTNTEIMNICVYAHCNCIAKTQLYTQNTISFWSYNCICFINFFSL